MSIRIIVAISALLLALPATAAGWNLDGRWQVVEAQPTLPEARGHIGTLRISANQAHTEAREHTGIQDGRYDLSVSGACNGVSGTLEIAGGAPDFQAEASTAQVCPDERGAFDRAFHQAVFGAERLSLEEARLMLDGPNGKLTFARME